MGNYYIIKREFSFLETRYGFKRIMKQNHGAYCFILWTNGVKKIMVLFDDRIDEKKESPIKIRVYDANCYGTYYDNVDEYKNELKIDSKKSKCRINYAAEWVFKAIENKIIIIE